MKKLQEEAIRRHGLNLLALFPRAAEQDPIKLCKKLRRLQSQAEAITLRMCNGPEYQEDEADNLLNVIMDKLTLILGNDITCVPIFINRDPRGYAFKIHDTWLRERQQMNLPGACICKDWGGYGIIAPNINEKGE